MELEGSLEMIDESFKFSLSTDLKFSLTRFVAWVVIFIMDNKCQYVFWT